MTATGTSSLPPHSFATGSAVVNMFRQIGLAVGVAVLIAILGSPHSPLATLATLDVYRCASVLVAALSLAGGVAGAWLLAARRQPITAPTDAPAPVMATSAPGEHI